MSYGAFEDRIIAVFAHFGMIEQDPPDSGSPEVVDITEAMAHLSKDKLLKYIGELDEAFLGMQAISPGHSLYYLSFIIGALFELVSHTNQDVRIAADETINQLVKLTGIHLTQHMICEFFIEIKRNQLPQSLAMAIRKFSACVDKISPKKRRMYAIHILPVLGGIVTTREEELVWECLGDSMEAISACIFPHTSQREIIEMLLQSLLSRLDSEKNYIRRAAAEVIVSTTINSRLPHELCYRLLQHLVGRVFTLKQRFLMQTVQEISQPSSHPTAMALQGCLMTLRNLAHNFSRVPSPPLRFTSTPYGCKTKAERCPRDYLLSSLGPEMRALVTKYDNIETDTAVWGEQKMLEAWWWRIVRLECLELATFVNCRLGGYSLIQATALECLLEVLNIPQETHFTDSANQALLVFFNHGLDGVQPLDLQQHATETTCSATASHSVTGSDSFDFDDLPKNPNGKKKEIKGNDTDDFGVQGGLDEVKKQPVTLVLRPLLAFSSETALNLTTTLSKSEAISAMEEASFTEEVIPEADVNEEELGCFRRGLFAETASCLDAVENILPFFAARFDLLASNEIEKKATSGTRTSTQMLATACLAKLAATTKTPGVFLRPLDFSLCSKQHATEEITGIELIQHLITHSDPQIRGNACLLAGNLLRSFSINRVITPVLDSSIDMRRDLASLLASIHQLLVDEKSGVTYRLALKALRCCANPILNVIPNTSDEQADNDDVDDDDCNHPISALLVGLLSDILVPAARHPYRLVRCELLCLVSQLDWSQLQFVERNYFTGSKGHRLVGTTSLFGVAWCESLRLFSDADQSIGRDAFQALLHLSALSSISASHDAESQLLFHRASSFFSSHSPLLGVDAGAYLLVNSGGGGFSHRLLSVAKELPSDLWVTPPLLPTSAATTTAALLTRRCFQVDHPPQVQATRGLHKLFRELTDCLLELPASPTTNEEKNMMHSLIFGLNELLGRPGVLHYQSLWYTPSRSPKSAASDADDNESAPIGLNRAMQNQRRPKMALLCWHCLGLLTASQISATDLHMHAELLICVSGCLLRWGVSGLLEGSIPAGGTMELHVEHAFTRVSMVLLRHIGRLLSVFWHVLQDVKPMHGSFFSEMLQTSFRSTVASQGSTHPLTNSAASSAIKDAQLLKRSQIREVPVVSVPQRIQIVQPSDVDDEDERLILGSRNTFGYFANLPNFVDLFETVKASFQAYKSSPDLSSQFDRTFELLSSTLTSLSRLLEGLRFAEVVPIVEEFLCYLDAYFPWCPAEALDAALNLLRSLFGTNLSSIWNRNLATKYRSLLDTSPGSQHLMTPSDETDWDELLNALQRLHVEALSNSCCGVYSSPLIDHQKLITQVNALLGGKQPIISWLQFSRASPIAAMLRPTSMPSHSQQPNLAYYIRLFEPLILQCLHQYSILNNPLVQAKILEALTILIGLGVNYSQLDEDSHFLKTVMLHCESLQHSNNANASCAQKSGSEATCLLVSNMFQFFVALTYERRAHHQPQPTLSPSPMASIPPSSPQSSTILSLSEVVHLMELLAAGGVDTDTVVFSALAPLVIEVFVQRAAKFRSSVPGNAQVKVDPPSPLYQHELLEWRVQRESMFNFLVPKYILHPAAYDFLCVILEDAALTDRLQKSKADSSLWYHVAEKIVGGLLPAMAENKICLETGGTDGLLRLVVRLTGPWPETAADENVLTYSRLLIQLLTFILQPKYLQEFGKQKALEKPVRHVAARVVCLRFIHALLLVSPDSRHESPKTERVDSVHQRRCRRISAIGLTSFSNIVASHPYSALSSADPPLATVQIFLDGLLYLLSETCNTLIYSLPSYMDTNQSSFSSVEKENEHDLMNRLLIALEMDILAFLSSGLFTLVPSPVTISEDKLNQLDSSFCVLGSLEPLFAGLWCKIRERFWMISAYCENVIDPPSLFFPGQSALNFNLATITHLPALIQLRHLIRNKHMHVNIPGWLKSRTGSSSSRCGALKTLNQLTRHQKKQVVALMMSNTSDANLFFQVWRDSHASSSICATEQKLEMLNFCLENVGSQNTQDCTGILVGCLELVSELLFCHIKPPSATILVHAERVFVGCLKRMVELEEIPSDLARLAREINCFQKISTSEVRRLISQVLKSGVETASFKLSRFGVESPHQWFHGAFEGIVSEDGSVSLLVQLLQGLITFNEDDGTASLEDLIRTLLRTGPHITTSARLLLQQMVRIGYANSMNRFNSGSNPSPSTGDDHFKFDQLYRVGTTILFEELKQLHLIADTDTSPTAQSRLAGLSAASIDFLRLSESLPVPGRLSDEQMNLLCSLLIRLMTALTDILSRDQRKNAKTPFALMSLPSLTIQMASIVLQSPSLSDTLFRFGHQGEDIEANANDPGFAFNTIVQFLEAVNFSASFSSLVTPAAWSCLSSLASETVDAEHKLRALMMPRQPGVFKSSQSTSRMHSHPHAPATVLVRFTETLNSFASNSSGSTVDRHIPTCHVVGQCRLLPQPFSLALEANYGTVLIALARRPEVIDFLRHAKSVSVTSGSTELLPDKVAQLDRESLAEMTTRFICLGWVNRRMFETTWMSCLAVCNSNSGDEDEEGDASSMFEGFGVGKEELIEQNQCRVLSVNALTRLVLMASQRPNPGDPLSSQSEHRPRLPLPTFINTRVGWKLAQTLQLVEENLSKWCENGGVARPLPTYLSSLSDSSSFSWLSANLNFSCRPLAVSNDAPFGHLSIEWLAKRIQLEERNENTESILSCLQSLRLIFQTWLPSIVVQLKHRFRHQQSLQQQQHSKEKSSMRALRQRINLLRRARHTARMPDTFMSYAFAYEESIIACGLLDDRQPLEQEEDSEIVSVSSTAFDLDESSLTSETSLPTSNQLNYDKLPSIGLLTVLIKSAVISSCLFTTREQYLWLVGCLQSVSASLPSMDKFEAPIYIWLTLGLARCTAVLEATMLSLSSTVPEVIDPPSKGGPSAPQQHQSAPILLPENLEPAVSLALLALQSSLSPLQDAGLQAACDLLEASLLLEATRHPAMQQPNLLAHSPTGSPLLNNLLLMVCRFLERRLISLFAASTKEHQLTLENTAAGALKQQLMKGAFANSFMGGIPKLMGTTRSPSTVPPSHFGSGSASVALDPETAASERVMSHQLAILSTAFYLLEQFGAAEKSATTMSQAVTSGLRSLANAIVGLAIHLLRDTPRSFLPPARLNDLFSKQLGGTTMSMGCGWNVVLCWVRGIQRLLAISLLSRDSCESLAKLALDRFMSSGSVQLSFPCLSLLVTCLHVMNSVSGSSGEVGEDQMTQECINNLWERLRGSGSQGSKLVGVSGRSISPLEARIVSRLLGILSGNMVAFTRTEVDEEVGNRLSLGAVINKAVSEIARLDHTFPQLAGKALSSIFARFFDSSEGSRELLRQWLFLSLPSLLRRQPEVLAFWASTVCLLSATSNATLSSSSSESPSVHRATLLLCLACPPRLGDEHGAEVVSRLAGGLNYALMLSNAICVCLKDPRGLFNAEDVDRKNFIELFKTFATEEKEKQKIGEIAESVFVQMYESLTFSSSDE